MQVPYYSLQFGIGCEVCEVISLEMKAEGSKIHNFFRETMVPFVELRNSKLPFSKPFSCLFQFYDVYLRG
jgi:hypothetical protein